MCLKALSLCFSDSCFSGCFSNIVLSFFKYLKISFDKIKKPPLIYSEDITGFSEKPITLDFLSSFTTPNLSGGLTAVKVASDFFFYGI